MSSDDAKKGTPSEQELIRELASILTESGVNEEKATGAAKKATAAASSAAGVDQDLIRELADLLTETGLTEIELDQNGLRVRVARTASVQSVGVAAPAAPAAAAPESAPASNEPQAGAVTSPMVGTAYVAAEPGAKPFVQQGDSVREGQTVLIVEAMKTMNPIPAPKSGKVTQVLVDDGQPVEFGEALMIIE